jgi:hypothetical protein
MKDDKGVKQLWEKMKQQKEEQEKSKAKPTAAQPTTAPPVKKSGEGEKAKAESTGGEQGEGVTIEDAAEEDEAKQQEENVNKLLENISIFSDMQRDKHEREEQLEYAAPSAPRHGAHAHTPYAVRPANAGTQSIQEANGSQERDSLPGEVCHQGQGDAKHLLGQPIDRVPPGNLFLRALMRPSLHDRGGVTGPTLFAGLLHIEMGRAVAGGEAEGAGRHS